MRVTIQQDTFKRVLGKVLKVVNPRHHLPVLRHIHIEADERGLTVSATDLECFVSIMFSAARIDEPGSMCLPAKMLADVVSHVPAGAITLTGDEASAIITAGRSTSTLRGLPTDDFPRLPQRQTDPPLLTIQPDTLGEIARIIASAAATTESRPALAGVVVQPTGERMALAAADGYRMAFGYLPLPDTAPDTREVIAPRRAWLLTDLFDTEDPVSLHVARDGTALTFQTDTVLLTSRIIDGTFPDFLRIVPSEEQHHIVARVKRAALLAELKLAEHFAVPAQGVVRLTIDAGEAQTLTIWANAAEVGDSQAVLGCSATPSHQAGDRQMTVAANVKFLLAHVAALAGDVLTIRFTSPAAPLVLAPVTPNGIDDTTVVVMPMI